MKKSYLIAGAALALLVTTGHVSAAEATNVYADQYSVDGFKGIFVHYYKWSVLWLLMLDVLVSIFIGLLMLGAGDRESHAKWKSSLINVNASFLSLAFLGGIVYMVDGAMRSKVSNITKYNETMVMATAFSDVSAVNNGFTENYGTDKFDMNQKNVMSTNIRIASKDRLDPDTGKPLAESADKMNKFVATAERIYDGLIKKDETAAARFLSLPTANASEPELQGLQQRIVSASQDPASGISPQDVANFNEMYDKYGLFNSDF